MARVLVNYTYNKSKDEYKIMDYSCGVFADIEVAVLDTNLDIKEPLVVPIQGVMTVVDRKSYEEIHKRFVFSVNEHGKVEENEKGDIVVWLPKNTDVSKLRVVNNQLVLIKEEQQIADEKPAKKPNKRSN